ncbi:hypothetical protein HAX54_041318 [Datura stramonium]|uniref:F-box domain-containing protein n=1 Tax=Datura stramonium TaxID=4076 RepID=A0ABS8VR43_DATST|nr:hypothetical protein [Datura stramonium]
MSDKKSHKSNINIPHDILLCILLRLPVKSLLRFRCVSTWFNDIISSKEFKKAQSDQSKALGRVNFLAQKCYSEANQQAMFVFPLKGFECPHVLCSHDGLVLLKNRMDDKKFFLWNPSTRQCLELASCPYLNINTLPRGCGLCYDPTTYDYKVILMYNSFYLVYSMRNFWRKKTPPPMIDQHVSSSLERPTNSCPAYICEGISTEGCVYWSIDQRLFKHHVRRDSTIIYFDMKSDEFKELPKPNFIGDDELFRLTALKGRLCLYNIWSNKESEVNMWIMDEDGWKLSMKLPKISEFCTYGSILCCMENGEIIFQGPENCYISIYKPTQQKFVIKDFISNYYIGYGYANPYPICLDSLHFPKIIHKRNQPNSVPLLW